MSCDHALMRKGARRASAQTLSLMLEIDNRAQSLRMCNDDEFAEPNDLEQEDTDSGRSACKWQISTQSEFAARNLGLDLEPEDIYDSELDDRASKRESPAVTATSSKSPAPRVRAGDDDDLVLSSAQSEIHAVVSKICQQVNASKASEVGIETAFKYALPNGVFSLVKRHLQSALGEEDAMDDEAVSVQDLVDFTQSVLLTSAIEMPPDASTSSHSILSRHIKYGAVTRAVQVFRQFDEHYGNTTASGNDQDLLRLMTFINALDTTLHEHCKASFTSENQAFLSLDSVQTSFGLFRDGTDSNEKEVIDLCTSASSGLILWSMTRASKDKMQPRIITEIAHNVAATSFTRPEAPSSAAASAATASHITNTNANRSLSAVDTAVAYESSQIDRDKDVAEILPRFLLHDAKDSSLSDLLSNPDIQKSLADAQLVLLRSMPSNTASSLLNISPNGSDDAHHSISGPFCGSLVATNSGGLQLLCLEQNTHSSLRKGRFVWCGASCPSLASDWTLCFRRERSSEDPCAIRYPKSLPYEDLRGSMTMLIPGGSKGMSADWYFARLFRIDELFVSYLSEHLQTREVVRAWTHADDSFRAAKRRRVSNSNVTQDVPNKETFLRYAMQNWFPQRQLMLQRSSISITRAQALRENLAKVNWELGALEGIGFSVLREAPSNAVSQLVFGPLSLREHGTTMQQERVVLEFTSRFGQEFRESLQRAQHPKIWQDDQEEFCKIVPCEQTRIRIRHKCSVTDTRYALVVENEHIWALIMVTEASQIAIRDSMERIAHDYLDFAYTGKTYASGEFPYLGADVSKNYGGSCRHYNAENALSLWRACTNRDACSGLEGTFGKFLPRAAGLWELTMQMVSPPHEELQSASLHFDQQYSSASLSARYFLCHMYQSAYNAWRLYTLCSQYASIMHAKSYAQLQRALQPAYSFSAYLLALCTPTSESLFSYDPNTHSGVLATWGPATHENNLIAGGLLQNVGVMEPAPSSTQESHLDANTGMVRVANLSSGTVSNTGETRGLQLPHRHLVPVEGPKYNRIKGANTEEGRRTRLDTSLPHFHVHAPPRKDKNVARLSCAICCRMCASDKDHEYRIGRGTSKWCSVCHVALCKKCFQPFHTLRNIPVPKCIATKQINDGIRSDLSLAIGRDLANRGTHNGDNPHDILESDDIHNTDHHLSASGASSTEHPNDLSTGSYTVIAAVGATGTRRLSPPMLTYAESTPTLAPGDNTYNPSSL